MIQIILNHRCVRTDLKEPSIYSSGLAMAPRCCSCNGSGRCKGCSCVCRGSPCVDCYLGETRCLNRKLPEAPKGKLPGAPKGLSQQTSRRATVSDGAIQPIPSTSAVTTADHVGTNLSANFADQLPHPTVMASTSPRQEERQEERAAFLDDLELPAFQPAPPPRFDWGLLDGDDFSHALSAAYAEAMHWRRNIFSIPSGAAGKAFVLELSRLIRAFAERSTLEAVAMKAIMVMPHLLLQKPHPSSISKDHQVCLERRLASRLETRRH